MYRIRSASGRESVYNSLEEFTQAVRRGEVLPEDEIFHSRAGRWLDVRSHPHYRVALPPGGDARSGPVAVSTTAPTPASAPTTVGPQLQAAPTPAPSRRQPKSRDLVFIEVPKGSVPTSQRNAMLIEAQRAPVKAASPAKPASLPTPEPLPKPATLPKSESQRKQGPLPTASDNTTGDFLVMDGGIESPVRTSTGIRIVKDEPESLVQAPAADPAPTTSRAVTSARPMGMAPVNPVRSEVPLLAVPEAPPVPAPEPVKPVEAKPAAEKPTPAPTSARAMPMLEEKPPVTSTPGLAEPALILASCLDEPIAPKAEPVPEMKPALEALVANPPTPVNVSAEPPAVLIEKLPEPVVAKESTASLNAAAVDSTVAPAGPSVQPPVVTMAAAPMLEVPPAPAPPAPKSEPKRELVPAVSVPKLQTSSLMDVGELIRPTPAAKLQTSSLMDVGEPIRPTPAAKLQTSSLMDVGEPIRPTPAPQAPAPEPRIVPRSAPVMMDTARMVSPSRMPVIAAGIGAVLVAGALLAWRPWSGSGEGDVGQLGTGLSSSAATIPAGRPSSPAAAQPAATSAPSFGADAKQVPGAAPERAANEDEVIVAAAKPNFRPKIDFSGASIDVSGDVPGGTVTAVPSPSALAENLVAAEREAQQELAARLGAVNFRAVLTPARLSNASGVDAAKASWTAGADAIRQYRAKIARLEKTYEDSMLVSQRGQRWPAAELRAWAARPSLAEPGETSQLGDLMVSQVSEALELLAASEGQYDVRGGSIGFRAPTAATRYTSIRTWVEQRMTNWSGTPESARPHTVTVMLTALGDGLPPLR